MITEGWHNIMTCDRCTSIHPTDSQQIFAVPVHCTQLVLGRSAVPPPMLLEHIQQSAPRVPYFRTRTDDQSGHLKIHHLASTQCSFLHATSHEKFTKSSQQLFDSATEHNMRRVIEPRPVHTIHHLSHHVVVHTTPNLHTMFLTGSGCPHNLIHRNYQTA